jgi:hypothetical protein
MNAILTRAGADREFRQTLLADPKTAILKSFGIQVPDDFKLRFIEKPSDLDALIVLPDPPSSGALSDEELESVAGGTQGAHWAPPPPPPAPPPPPGP